MTNPEPNPAREENYLSRRSSLLGLGVVAVTFVLTAALTWRKWPDLLIDFGGQLYIPWRILNGAVLYRDLFYFAGGPFSQYFNALLFKMFGVSFGTLIAANVVFTAAILLLIYRRFLAATDVWTAAIIGTGVVFVFAFAQYTEIGNYNYITPYSHELVHGLFLSIVTIALLSDWINWGKTWNALVAGFCAGLVFLTKPDVCLALAVMTIAAFVLYWLKWRQKGFLKSLGAFVSAAVIPPLLFFFYFLHAENARASLRSVLFGWLPLLHGTVTKSPFYLWCLGLDYPRDHLKEIIIYSLRLALVVALYVIVLRVVKRIRWNLAQYLAVAVLFLPLVFWAFRFNWIDCGWPLPFTALAACALIAWNYKSLEQPPVFPLLWSVFGLALLAKLGLFPRIWHYGFVLAMPAFVSSIYLLFWLLPRLLERKYGVPQPQFRIAVGLVFLIGFYSLFEGSQSLYRQKNLVVGSGGDKILTYNLDSEKSRAICTALAWSDKFMPPGTTLAVIPQGITLNYLTRHANPSPCLDWNPTMFTVFGQGRMTDAFEKNPPDYIFIVEWDSSEFGVGYFGSSPEYGQALMKWIEKNYQPQVLIGNEPLKDKKFGIKILKRRPPLQTQSGGFNASKSLSSSADKKFIPTSNDASVQPKPSGVM